MTPSSTTWATRVREFILCNHEEIAVALAQGYGRAAGKPMAAFVHDIVGLLHASMAMFNAWMGRSGVLVLGATGPLDAHHRRPWIDWVHTANVQGEAVRNFVKWDDQPSSVQASVESLIRAYNLVTSEPQGPVYVCFDADVQEQKLTEPYTLPDFSRFPAPTRLQADPAALERVASALMAAHRPVVLANFLGRSEEATQGLLRLAESLALPVINGGDFFNFPTRHPLYANEAKEELLAEADLVLALDVYDLQQELTRLDRATRKTEDILRPDAMLIDISLRQCRSRAGRTTTAACTPQHCRWLRTRRLATPALADLVQRQLDDAAGSSDAIAARRERVTMLHEAALAKNQATAQTQAGEQPLALPTIAQELWEVVRDYDWVVGNGDLRGWVQRLWDIRHPLPGRERPRRRRPRRRSGARHRRRAGQPRQGQAHHQHPVGRRHALHAGGHLDGGAPSHSAAYRHVQQPHLRQRPGAPRLHGAGAGPPDGASHHRHRHQRPGGGLRGAGALLPARGLRAQSSVLRT